MDDRFNTIAGWVLGAAIVALGASIVTGEVFRGERPETMGYPIEGVELESDGGAEAEKPIAFYLASATAEQGAQVFKKCAACHTDSQGAPNGLGPNLWGNMGQKIAHVPGFAYSDALKSHGGNWDWDNMSEWLKSPRNFAPGTKMTFAGLSKPEDRAAVMLFLNQQGGGLPIPPPPAVDTPAEVAAENGDADAAAGKAPDQPEVNEAAAAAQPEGNIGGDGAPAVTGRAEQEKNQ